MVDVDSVENKDGLSSPYYEENIMSVSSIGASLITSAQNVASGAKKKLAKLQAQQQQQAAEQQPSDPNKGTLVDHVA
jgi:hypothetical protein